MAGSRAARGGARLPGAVVPTGRRRLPFPPVLLALCGRSHHAAWRRTRGLAWTSSAGAVPPVWRARPRPGAGNLAAPSDGRGPGEGHRAWTDRQQGSLSLHGKAPSRRHLPVVPGALRLPGLRPETRTGCGRQEQGHRRREAGRRAARGHSGRHVRLAPAFGDAPGGVAAGDDARPSDGTAAGGRPGRARRRRRNRHRARGVLESRRPAQELAAEVVSRSEAAPAGTRADIPAR